MYDRIFWLDDNPNFLEWIQILGTELDPSFSIAELLRRITWAYDFESLSNRDLKTYGNV